jgi:uncharacterized protein (TIGR00369 family)
MSYDASPFDPPLNAAPNRSRIVTWDDPLAGAARIPTMSGLDYLHAMINGTIAPPPIAKLMRFTLTEATPGRAVFECHPDEASYNPIGTIHGGLVCTLLDSAVGCAVQTMLPQGQGYTSIEIKVNYLRPVHSSSGPLHCVGTVTKPGSRVAFAEGVVTDASGKLVATASSTLLVFAV